MSDPEEIAYYRAYYSSEDAPLSELAKVTGVRWSIEECLERAKGEVSLDHYEVRRWEGWHRYVTLCLLVARAFLEVTRATSRSAGAEEKGRRRR